MFSKEEHKKTLRFINSNWSEDEIESMAITMEKKYATIKSGENVIHLDYYSPLLTENDINYIEKNFSKVNHQLSYFDKTGVPYASINDFILQVAVILSLKTTQDIIIGAAGSALWDAIKYSTLYIWKRQNKHIVEVIGQNLNEAKINFGVTAQIDEHTSYDFKFEGDSSDEKSLLYLDKILDFLREAKPNETPKRADFVVFDKEFNEWKTFDVNAEIRKKYLTE